MRSTRLIGSMKKLCKRRRTTQSRRTRLFRWSIGLLLFSTVWAPAGAETQTRQSVPYLTYEIVERYPHDKEAFTQGLLFVGGVLYESTGLYGRSSIREVDISSGKPTKLQALPAQFFGEGLAFAEDHFFLLTYKAGIGFVLDKDNLRRVRQFKYPGEGWGLAFDGEHLVMSDGSNYLEFRDPETFDVVRTIRVSLQGRLISNLNELEVVGDRIFANVYGADQIIRINPENGEVDGIIDLTGIIDNDGRGSEPGGAPPVLNGIAYDPTSGHFFVTGKLWSQLFELKVDLDQ
ncbi:MAG: glutaminyl-peptide cyclotransferase [Pseudomonadota bacterium]